MDTFTLFWDVHPALPIVAFVLDQLLGDPVWLYHPVRLLGRAINRLEALCRRIALDERGLRFAGAMATLGLSVVVFGSLTALLNLKILGGLFSLYFAYSGLALRCLLDEGKIVESFLEDGDVEKARHRLSYLVSRDTATMDEDEIRRSLAETLSENFSDGVIAPLFYLVFLGPAAMWVYKTVNTFDSMWGYRTERFQSLGWFPARLDDMLNWIPARISAGMLMLASWNFNRDDLRRTVRQAASMESPNAGWPMAACANLLHARMGGATSYFGKIKEKPILGRGGSWDSEKIKTLSRLLIKTGWISLGLFVVVKWMIPYTWSMMKMVF